MDSFEKPKTYFQFLLCDVLDMRVTSKRKMDTYNCLYHTPMELENFTEEDRSELKEARGLRFDYSIQENSGSYISDEFFEEDPSALEILVHYALQANHISQPFLSISDHVLFLKPYDWFRQFYDHLFLDDSEDNMQLVVERFAKGKLSFIPDKNPRESLWMEFFRYVMRQNGAYDKICEGGE